MPRIVALGGRSGPSLIVEGFQGSDWDLTALVTTTDSGSSSGIIRDQFGLPAPGDIRSVLVAAAVPRPDLERLVSLFEFRFHPAQDCTLRNMALGNLILTAFAEALGDFAGAVQAVARFFGCWAEILPIPSSAATLCARLVDGSVVRGELNVRAVGKPPIAEVFLDPSEPGIPEAAIQAVLAADLIVLGPGGLYCSVLPTLLPSPIRQAIRGSRARTAYICNTTTQPGQTDGLDAAAHVRELIKYVGEGRLDYVLLNTQPPTEEMITAYRQEGVHFMPVRPEEVRRVKALGPIPVVGDFVEDEWRGKRALHKLDTIRHHPRKVASALRAMITEDATRAATAGGGASP